MRYLGPLLELTSFWAQDLTGTLTVMEEFVRKAKL